MPNNVPEPRAVDTSHSVLLHAENSFAKLYAQLIQAPPDFLKSAAATSSVQNAVWTQKDRFFEKFNYDIDANSFNRAFFLKNLYKCLVALTTFQAAGYLHDTEVVDVGRGAGAFTGAWNTIFWARRHYVTLNDTSQLQLESARQVITALDIHKCCFSNCDFLAEANDLRGLRL